jgi:hypothetical protein
MWYPTEYPFLNFYFGDPQNSPYGLPPFKGYKWYLLCRNSDNVSAYKVMYGVAQP